MSDGRARLPQEGQTDTPLGPRCSGHLGREPRPGRVARVSPTLGGGRWCSPGEFSGAFESQSRLSDNMGPLGKLPRAGPGSALFSAAVPAPGLARVLRTAGAQHVPATECVEATVNVSTG